MDHQQQMLVMRELEAAANVIMGPPQLVSHDQRQTAESVVLNFRKSKLPYETCRYILENSRVHYVLFEAAEVLKSALIREFSYLDEPYIVALRQYLMHYVTSREDLPAFVQDKLLQVIAIMVKRSSVDDFGHDRSNVIKEIEHVIVTGNIQKQILGCKMIQNLMQEYSNTIKSSDVGLPWEVHFKVKKLFEATDLKQIFRFTVQLLADVTQKDPPYAENTVCLMEHLLTIAEHVLTWGYIPPILPRRIIGVYESVFEADQAPALRLTSSWKEVMLAPQLLPLLFQVYWKVREEEERLSSHALTLLVQMATLSGSLMNDERVKLQYFNAYVENFLKLIRNVVVSSKESLGISNIVRKLQLFFARETSKLLNETQEMYVNEMTRLTVYFCEGAAMEESQSIDDKYFTESFENMLEGWLSLVQDQSDRQIDTALLTRSSMDIFNVYLKCHLAAPDGCRGHNPESTVIDDDIEDTDRIKYKDQLQTIGLFGRLILSHSLPVLYRCLETRTRALRANLNEMRCRAMTIAESNCLDDLFEDLHWLILIAGHVLCMECDGETPLIPREVMCYSSEMTMKEGGVGGGAGTNLEETLKYMATVQEDDFQSVASTSSGCRGEFCDSAIRVFTDVLHLCRIETHAAASTNPKLGQFMSPEMGCTTMWFLKRWCLSYLMPSENCYQELSPILSGALGSGTDGAAFVVDQVLSKIRANVAYYNTEPILLRDTVELLDSLVAVKQKSAYIVKTKELWQLYHDQQTDVLRNLLPAVVRRGLYRALVLAGAGLTEPTEAAEYYNQIVKPLHLRFKQVLSKEDINLTYQQADVRKELADVLDCLIGTARGVQIGTVRLLFDNYISPVLGELPALLQLYNQTDQVIVQSILELFGQCAKQFLCYLNVTQTRQMYESALAVIRTYAKCNANRFCIVNAQQAEDDTYQDLSLVMDMLTFVLSKDCLDLTLDQDENSEDAQQSGVTAADVSLCGLNFIMPLMTADLLKYPNLCAQYYRLIVLIDDIYPDKICNLPDELLRQLLTSVEMGLTQQFGSDVGQACLDFVQGLATYLHRESLRNVAAYNYLLQFLSLIFGLTLTRQINSDLISTASTCVFALICCYGQEFQRLVGQLIESQTDPMVADRLTKAIDELMRDVKFGECERAVKLKFRDNFEKFLANVHGFLLVK